MNIKETNLDFSTLTERSRTNCIIIHHTASTKDDSAADIHAYHKNSLGWAGIGYHYLIRKDGIIERGRPEDCIGAHCYGWNDLSIGIALCGNFETEEPTAAQISSLLELAAYLKDKYNLADAYIFGHRDKDATACPGKNLYSRLPAIRCVHIADDWTKESGDKSISGKIFAHGGKWCIAIDGKEYELNADVANFAITEK